MKLAGIDLAWKSETNTTAVVFGNLKGRHLGVTGIHPALKGLSELISVIDLEGEIHGVAIDAPLVINNPSKQRGCEKSLSKEYAARGAACHASNLKLYPNCSSVELAHYLEKQEFRHLRNANMGKFQIECYPHPAIIEIFGLPRRLSYKKGTVLDKQQGQIQLSKYIKALERSKVLQLR